MLPRLRDGVQALAMLGVVYALARRPPAVLTVPEVELERAFSSGFERGYAKGYDEAWQRTKRWANSGGLGRG
jgi:hypothetical protein